jgi:hypothetical protein
LEVLDLNNMLMGFLPGFAGSAIPVHLHAGREGKSLKLSAFPRSDKADLHGQCWGCFLVIEPKDSCHSRGP